MDPQRWREIRAVFNELVELEPDRRAGRLAALSAGDPQLRKAVESLLAADAASSGGLGGAALPPRGDQHGLLPDPLGLAGSTVSHFRVLDPLEIGGMGVVYRAEDTRLGRAVALKFLLPHHVLDASAKQRFLHEARTAGALDHPNLCTIYEVGESADGLFFLAMPLYPGETLKARLEREGALPVEDALAITRQIAQGLSCAHAAGIVHRDLKPGNVMLLPDGTVKVLDFGVAKARDLELTRSGCRLGTVSYMAPEQVCGEAVDARSDLWALGVVLYEMLTSRRPFPGEHETAIAHAIVNAEPVPPSALRPGLPAEVEELVLTALHKDPGSRPAGAPELLGELTAITNAAAPPARGGRSPRGRTKRPLARWLVLGGAAFVIGGGLATRPLWKASTEHTEVERRPTASLIAHEYVLRARNLLQLPGSRTNDAALDLIDEALVLDATYADAFAARAQVLRDRYWRRGEAFWLDSAVVAARYAISLDPGYASGYAELGFALNLRGDREAALEAQRRAVAFDPNLSGGLANLYEYDYGHLDEAVRLWERELETDPTNASTLFKIGRIYLHLGMPAHARTLFDRAKKVQPDYPWAHYYTSLAYILEGRPQEAQSEVQRMLAARESPDALIWAGHSTAALGNLPAARRYLERGFPEASQAWTKEQAGITLAWLLQQSGDAEGAHRVLQEVSDHFKVRRHGHAWRPEDHVQSARIRIVAGDREGAIQDLQVAVQSGWRLYNGNPNDPILNSLQGNPRYDGLIAEVKADIARMRTRVERARW
jgi:tetratricopeptide (TPR) repeat protein